MSIKELREQIIDVINKSGLSLDVIALVIENLSYAISKQLELAYAQEMAMPTDMPKPTEDKPKGKAKADKN